MLAGCSSTDSPGLGIVPTETGPAKAACGVPWTDVDCLCVDGQIGTGVCRPNGAVAPCACPAPIIDSGGAPDVAPDVPASDAAPDVAEDAIETLQRGLCLLGAPRLSWSVTGCTDNGGTVDITEPFPCTFRMASDGRVRCLPPTTGRGGWNSEGCAGLPNVTTWTTEPVPAYLLVGPIGGPFDTPIETNVTPSTFTPWWAWPGCVKHDDPYPTTAKGRVVFVKRAFAVTAFYAAPF